MRKSLSYILFLIMLSGCITGPRGSDYKEYSEKPFFTDNFYGVLQVLNQTGDSMKRTRWDEDKDQILEDLKESGRSFIEKDQKRTFKLTYQRCQKIGHTPTKSKVANGAINLLTLGVWPVGIKLNCQTDLDVMEPGQTKTFHATTNLEIEKRFSTLAFLNMGMIDRARWRLPSRRLLQMYEESQLKMKSVCEKDSDCVLFNDECGELSSVAKAFLPADAPTITKNQIKAFMAPKGTSKACMKQFIRAPTWPEKPKAKCEQKSCTIQSVVLEK